MLTTIRRPVTGLVAAAAILLTACGGSAEPPASTATGGDQAAGSPTGDTSPTMAATAPAASPTATASDPTTGTTERAEQDGSGDPVTVTDIVVERTDGVDRIVLDTAGGGTPGWVVQYVERAQQQGSGDEVDLEGDTVLEVLVTNTGYPFDTGEEEFSGDVEASGDVVREVSFQGVFEGQAQVFVGLDGRHPFDVSLEGSRIVIEILYG